MGGSSHLIINVSCRHIYGKAYKYRNKPQIIGCPVLDSNWTLPEYNSELFTVDVTCSVSPVILYARCNVKPPVNFLLPET